MAKTNRECPVCGKKFYACNSCGDRHTWKALCDTPQHYQIFVAISKYVNKSIDKDRARSFLEAAGIANENVDSFIADVKPIIAEIMYEKPAEKKHTRKPKIVKNDKNDL